MKLTLREAKDLYMLLFCEPIDGKQYIMDRLYFYIIDKDPSFDEYLLKQLDIMETDKF